MAAVVAGAAVAAVPADADALSDLPAVHAAPTASMTPTTSWPGTRGILDPGQIPSFVIESLWQMPQACTLMRTRPGPRSGMSRSTISKVLLRLDTWTARIFAMYL